MAMDQIGPKTPSLLSKLLLLRLKSETRIISIPDGSKPPKQLHPFIPLHPSRQKSSRLCQLPLEVLSLILSDLPPCSIAALALTCHGLYAIRQLDAIEAVRSNSHVRSRFLSLLEDHEGYLPCWICMKLHPLKGEAWEVEGPLSRIDRPLKGCEREAREVRLCEHYALQYRMLQLVWRGAKSGVGHGMPVSRLAHQCKRYDGKRKTMIETEVVPKVIDTHVFLKVTCRFHITAEPRDWEKALDGLLGKEAKKSDRRGFFRWETREQEPELDDPHLGVGCIHSHTSLPNLAKAVVSYHKFQHFEYFDGACRFVGQGRMGCCSKHFNTLHQCRWCATDFKLSAEGGLPSSTDGYILKITAYKDLGSNLLPGSSLWASATHPFSQAVGRRSVLPDGANSIQRVFEAAERFESEEVALSKERYEELYPYRESEYPCLQDWRTKWKPGEWSRLERQRRIVPNMPSYHKPF